MITPDYMQSQLNLAQTVANIQKLQLEAIKAKADVNGQLKMGTGPDGKSVLVREYSDMYGHAGIKNAVTNERMDNVTNVRDIPTAAGLPPETVFIRGFLQSHGYTGDPDQAPPDKMQYAVAAYQDILHAHDMERMAAAQDFAQRQAEQRATNQLFREALSNGYNTVKPIVGALNKQIAAIDSALTDFKHAGTNAVLNNSAALDFVRARLTATGAGRMSNVELQMIGPDRVQRIIGYIDSWHNSGNMSAEGLREITEAMNIVKADTEWQLNNYTQYTTALNSAKTRDDISAAEIALQFTRTNPDDAGAGQTLPSNISIPEAIQRLKDRKAKQQTGKPQ